MRIALLSVQHSPIDQRTVPAPFRTLAGARLVERQLDIALAAGCDTITCLATTVGREVMDLQHRAEAAGARFIALRDPHKLSGLVAAQDELLVFAAGVLPDEDVILRHLSKPCVLVFPEEPAIQRGYERIDANFAWSGALLARGTAVEQLAQLPGDVDVPSALLRIALQGGTRTQPLEIRLLEEHVWLNDPAPDELAARERSWVAGHADVASYTAPGIAVAERIGVRLARDALAGNLPRILGLSAALAALLALAFSMSGFSLAGFACAALAAIGLAMEGVVRRVAHAGRLRPRTPRLVQGLATLLDPLLIVLIALAAPETEGWLSLFVPVILFAILHLGMRIAAHRWQRTYADRVALTLLLVPAVAFGIILPVSAALALAAIMSLFLTSLPRD